MNILIIPDIHGRSFWEEAINDVTEHRREFDEVVFLGDYFDPYPTEDISECQAIINWERLYDIFFSSYLASPYHRGHLRGSPPHVPDSV